MAPPVPHSSFQWQPGKPGEIYYPGVFTFATDLFQPFVPVAKLVRDLNGGAVLPGDILEYTIVLLNSGRDDAVNVVLTDQIPTGTSYVLESMQITAAPPLAFTGTLTDAADDDVDDVAEFNTASNSVVFRLGTGATLSSGGRLARGESTTVMFRVQVPTTATLDTTISNTAVATYNGATLGTPYTTSGTKDVVVGEGRTTLDLRKNVTPQPTIFAGEDLTYTLTVTNAGPNSAAKAE